MGWKGSGVEIRDSRWDGERKEKDRIEGVGVGDRDGGGYKVGSGDKRGRGGEERLGEAGSFMWLFLSSVHVDLLEKWIS